jgi:hypothetical protein
MPAKNYKGRIEKNLKILTTDRFVQEVVDGPTADHSSNFQMVAYELTDGFSKDTPLAKAFREAGLSPFDAFHWHALGDAFAEVHYTPGSSGRPKIQTILFKQQLMLDLEAIYKEAKGGKVPDLSKALRARSPERYKTLKEHSGALSLLRRHGIRVSQFTSGDGT